MFQPRAKSAACTITYMMNSKNVGIYSCAYASLNKDISYYQKKVFDIINMNLENQNNAMHLYKNVRNV